MAARRASQTVILLCLCALLGMAAVGCAVSASEPAVYSITYELNGGTNYPDAPDSYTAGCSITLKAPSKLGYSFDGWYLSDMATRIDRIGPEADGDLILTAGWAIETLGLPALVLELEDGCSLENVERDRYQGAAASVLNSGDNSFSGAKLEIKGRGNTTWVHDKKSYKLKFDEKLNLFGMMDGGLSSKHWVIVGNYIDSSLSKNDLAYTLANDVFDNIPYTTGYQGVDLYVNGEYQGVYSVYEHIRAQKGRVDISSEYDVQDTGYLLEYDMLSDGTDGIDYFRVDGLPYSFRVDSPSPEDRPDDISFCRQVSFIRDYVQTVWDAIKRDDFTAVCELTDIDSVVDVYLLNELFKNSDVGLSSFYMYKEPHGKLYFGPVWDFDKSCQSCWQNNSPMGLLAGIQFDKNDRVLKTSNPIFYTLMQNQDFVTLVRDRWNDKRAALVSEISAFFDRRLEDTPSYSRNFELWTECGASEFQDSVTQLKTWLLCRVAWLTENDWAIVF